MSQKQVFFAGEGEAWLERNRKRIGGKGIDPILHAIEYYDIDPSVVLEIGCANGWRLERLEKKYGCVTWGVDPGAPISDDKIFRRSADNLGMKIGLFDTVIYGFCLYLCDPEDYFKIAAEGDRVLADGGFLIIHDFCTDHPYKVKYKHKEGLFSYHYDFSKLWLAHPQYSLYARTVQDETCVTILKKNVEKAFPEEE